jgi:hypothetical protein
MKLDLRWCRLLMATLALLPFAAQAAPQVAQVNGVDIAYSESGSGEPLVLIHGFGDCGSVWSAFLPNLSKHYRVISVELRAGPLAGLACSPRRQLFLAELQRLSSWCSVAPYACRISRR